MSYVGRSKAHEAKDKHHKRKMRTRQCVEEVEEKLNMGLMS